MKKHRKEVLERRAAGGKFTPRSGDKRSGGKPQPQEGRTVGRPKAPRVAAHAKLRSCEAIGAAAEKAVICVKKSMIGAILAGKPNAEIAVRRS